MNEPETLCHALGIDDTRERKLVWHVEEAMNTGCSKAEALQKFASVDASDVEKTYMGYLLVRFIIYRTTPRKLFDLICKLCDI